MSLTIDVELPGDLARFRLPDAVASRLQHLLDRQHAGRPLTAEERAEAEGLADLVDLLALLRLRAERAKPSLRGWEGRGARRVSVFKVGRPSTRLL